MFEDTWRISEVRQSHIQGQPINMSMTLYSCSLDDAPERVEHPSKYRLAPI